MLIVSHFSNRALATERELPAAIYDERDDIRNQGWNRLVAAENAKIEILRLANDESYVYRLEAIERLGSFPSPDSFRAIKRFFVHGNTGERAAAARAFGRQQAGTKPANLLLNAFATADDQVKSAIAEALPGIGNQLAWDKAQALLRDVDSPYRKYVVRGLAFSTNELAQAELIRALDSSDEEICLAAIQAVAIRGSAPEAKHLLRFLESENPELAQAAVVALKSFDNEVIPFLIDALKVSGERHKQRTVEILLEIAPEVAAKVLIGFLTDESPTIRLLAVNMLDTLRVVDAVPRLVALSNDVNREIRMSAIRALRNLDREYALPVFVCGLTDRDPAVRIACMHYLDDASGSAAVLHLSEMIIDSDATVSDEAIHLIAAHGQGAVPGIAGHLLSSRTDIRLKTIKVFEVMAHLENENLIVDRLNDEAESVRRAAIDYLVAVPTTSGLDALIAYSQHARVTDREYAQQAVDQIRGRLTSPSRAELACPGP